MKKLLLIFLLLYGWVIQVFSGRSLVSSAVTEIIREFNMLKAERFDFIIYETTKGILSGIVNEIVKANAQNGFPIHLTQVRESKDEIGIKHSAVIFFDTSKSFKKLHERAALKNDGAMDFYFLVYIHDNSEKKGEKNFTENDSV